ncbi:MAG: hypothetical protein J5685_08235 [Clostridiales bacterium]|nr:hypothetical protein [Clostridiales bacterium]
MAKIPFLFRFTRTKVIVLITLLIIWLVTDICLGVYIKQDSYDAMTVIEGRGMAVRTNFDSWAVFTAANIALVPILLWPVVGIWLDRKAFRQASKLTALHSDWERMQNRKEASQIREEVTKTTEANLMKKLENKAEFCPVCGLLILPEDGYCRTCNPPVTEDSGDQDTEELPDI